MWKNIRHAMANIYVSAVDMLMKRRIEQMNNARNIVKIYQRGHARILLLDDETHLFVCAHASLGHEPYEFKGKHHGEKTMDELADYIAHHASKEDREDWVKTFPVMEPLIRQAEIRMRISNLHSKIYHLEEEQRIWTKSVEDMRIYGLNEIMPDKYHEAVCKLGNIEHNLIAAKTDIEKLKNQQ